MLVLVVSIELYFSIRKHNSLPHTVTNAIQIISGLLERLMSIAKMKTLLTFPTLENYLIDLNILFNKWPKSLNLTNEDIDNFIKLTQKALGGFVCFIQIIGHVWNVNKQKYTIATDLLWSVFVITSMVHCTAVDPIIMSLIKVSHIFLPYNLYLHQLIYSPFC